MTSVAGVPLEIAPGESKAARVEGVAEIVAALQGMDLVVLAEA